MQIESEKDFVCTKVWTQISRWNNGRISLFILVKLSNYRIFPVSVFHCFSFHHLSMWKHFFMLQSVCIRHAIYYVRWFDQSYSKVESIQPSEQQLPGKYLNYWLRLRLIINNIVFFSIQIPHKILQAYKLSIKFAPVFGFLKFSIFRWGQNANGFPCQK